MLFSGLKYELDALANKAFQYLTKSYLPGKLKEEDWLTSPKRTKTFSNTGKGYATLMKFRVYHDTADQGNSCE